MCKLAAAVVFGTGSAVVKRGLALVRLVLNEFVSIAATTSLLNAELTDRVEVSEFVLS